MEDSSWSMALPRLIKALASLKSFFAVTLPKMPLPSGTWAMPIDAIRWDGVRAAQVLTPVKQLLDKMIP